MASARVSRGRKFGMGRRYALKVMVLGVVGLMSLAGTNPVMAASTQDNGSFWTQFTPSSDTRLIFVSSSEGNDANNGLTPATPVKTLARAESLLRDGFPDWMLLKRGDIWNESFPFWTKSGRSPNEKLVVGAYAEGSQRPQVRPLGHQAAIRNHGNAEVRHVAFVGLHLEPLTRANDEGASGVSWLRRSTDILFEDLYVAGFQNNFSIQSISEAAPVRDIRVNGCVVVDSWNTSGHSQGLFAKALDGLVIENSVFASNGFNLERGAQPTIFNHNIYIQNGTRGVIVRNNIIADASSHGLQLRPGGVVEGNFFLSNPISLLLGGGTNPDEGGVEGEVIRNVIMHGRNLGESTPRSFGIDLSNIREATVEDNIISMSVIGSNGNAITVGNSGEYGVSNLSISRNYVVNWHGSVVISDAPAGHVRRNIFLDRNYIYRDLTANGGNSSFNKPLVSVYESRGGLAISGNKYRYFGMHSRPFRVGSSNFSVESWAASVEPTGDFRAVGQPPVGFDIDSFLLSVGRSGSVEEFVLAARSHSRQSVSAGISSASVYNWMLGRLESLD